KKARGHAQMRSEGMNGGFIGLDIERCHAGDGAFGKAPFGKDIIDIVHEIFEADATFTADAQGQPSRVVDQRLLTPRYGVVGDKQAQFGVRGKRQGREPGSRAFRTDFVAGEKRSEKSLEVGWIGKGVASR